MIEVNLATVIDMRLWYTTLLLNGFNLIRGKLKLHKKLKGAGESSWSRPGRQTSFTLTIPWNLAKPVKT